MDGQMDRETGRYVDGNRGANRHIGRQTDGQVGRYGDRQMDRQKYGWMDQ
jgi:hypothetical protein